MPVERESGQPDCSSLNDGPVISIIRLAFTFEGIFHIQKHFELHGKNHNVPLDDWLECNCGNKLGTWINFYC